MYPGVVCIFSFSVIACDCDHGVTLSALWECVQREASANGWFTNLQLVCLFENFWPACVVAMQGHMNNMWKKSGDRTRCDWSMRQTQQAQQPIQQSQTQQQQQQIRQQQPVNAVISTATAAMNLSELARRDTTCDTFRCAYIIEKTALPSTRRARNMLTVQNEWEA